MIESPEALATAMSLERKRLWEILRVVDAWGPRDGPQHCPVCAALIVPTDTGRWTTGATALRQRHIDWHLRCLQ